VNPSRRTFLAAGAFGALALAAAGWLRGPHAPANGATRHALNADGEAIIAAVASVLLAAALPTAPPERQQAVSATLGAVDRAIHGLPPSAQAELAQLFALLASPPVRVAFARVGGSWDQASGADVRAFLDRLRASRWTLQRAAYDALHQLVFAAWYGNPAAWPALGYMGPPVLSGPHA
jgi:hypothetical protein